jgi:predicted enzyme related to lactoylglutathione lyase
MAHGRPNPVVHLELHTADRSGACDFFARVCGRGWGVVESGPPEPLWLPYVEVADIDAMTERARGLGARVLAGPREGPTGRRSVVAAPAGGGLALWQPRSR